MNSSSTGWCRLASCFLAFVGGIAFAQTPPTISAITAQTINEDTPTAAIPFTVNDAETPLASLVVTATSSNATLVPVANVVIGGAGGGRTVTITPVANLSGTSTIRLTVTDGSASTAFTEFLLTVNPVNDIPSFTLVGNQTITFSAPTQVSVANFATAIDDGDPDFTQTLTFNVTASNSAMFTPGGQPAIASDGTLTYTPSGVYGIANIDVSLTDDATAGGVALTTATQTRTIRVNNPAPVLGYLPNPADAIVSRRAVYMFNGAPLPGQTRTGQIAVTPSAGVGTGPLSTSTINSCAISGPDASAYSSVAGVNLTFEGASTTAQNIPLTCTSAIATANATLTCAETRGTAPPVNRVWPLLCPSCYFSITTTLDGTVPDVPAALSVPSATGVQTGRMNRFAAVSACGDTKTNPGAFTSAGSRQFDRYTLTPTTNGCVMVRLVSPGTTMFTKVVASPYNPATPPAGWIADPGSSADDIAYSFNATAGTSYDVIVHEVNPGGGVGGQYTLQVDTCNVPPPVAEISINDVSLAEGNAGTTNAVFTVTRTNSTTAFSVPFTATAGSAPMNTATPGADFTAVTGTLTFAAGGPLTQTISVPIVGDTQFEADETFAVELGTITNTTGFTVATKSVGVGTIQNDDSRSADLSITKTNGRTSSTPGTTVTYTITASNAGPDDASSSTVTDTFPAAIVGVTWTCVGAGGGTCTASGSDNINDTVNLPAGASVTYTATGTISASALGSLSNTATVTVSALVTDPASGNNSATDTDTLVGSADLAITKTDGVTSVVPGSSVTYTVVARNNGPSVVSGANVVDTFPAALTGVTWSCVGAGGGSCTAAGSGNINDSVILPVGASVTYTATATLSASASGTLTNTATVSSGTADPTPGNNSATDADSIEPRADLAITKTNGRAVSDRGGSVTYTIVASNAGPLAVTGASVADTLPATLINATWTCVGAGGGSCSASGSGNIADTVNLPTGATVTYTLTATVSSTATGTISNTATITAPATIVDAVSSNNTATDTDTVNIPTFVVSGGVAGSGGSVTCVSPVNFGETTMCTIVADPAYRLVNVSGCGGTLQSETSYVTGPITAACTVTASFTLTAISTMPSAWLIALFAACAALGLFGAPTARRRR